MTLFLIGRRLAGKSSDVSPASSSRGPRCELFRTAFQMTIAASMSEPPAAIARRTGCRSSIRNCVPIAPIHHVVNPKIISFAKYTAAMAPTMLPQNATVTPSPTKNRRARRAGKPTASINPI